MEANGYTGIYFSSESEPSSGSGGAAVYWLTDVFSSAISSADSKVRTLVADHCMDAELRCSSVSLSASDAEAWVSKACWAAKKRFVKFKLKFPRARNLKITGIVLGCIEANFCK